MILRQNERGSMRWQEWKATTMNNNIEVMKSVWRRVKRPSIAKLRRIKAKAELEARVTLRYMALLAAVLTMLMIAFAPMVHGQDVGLAVFNHQTMVGMTYGNVVASWGKPVEVNRSISPTERSSGGGTTTGVD
jgi:hypothetical protein